MSACSGRASAAAWRTSCGSLALMAGDIVDDDVDIEIVGHIGPRPCSGKCGIRAPDAGRNNGRRLCRLPHREPRTATACHAGIVVSAALRLRWPHRQQGRGAVQGLDLRFLVEAQHRRALRPGHVAPDNVTHPGSGPGQALLDKQRVGREFEAVRAVRLQAESLPDAVDRRGAWPTAAAIARNDHCVASGGVVSSVRRIVSAISSSPMRRGAPLRGSSRSPSTRRSAKRRRHFPTVFSSAPTARAITWFSMPAAAASTIRARRAKPCAVRRRFAKPSSSARSRSRQRDCHHPLPH
jgi:hypothetical protein